MELLGRAVLPSAHPTDDPVRQGLSKSPEATQPAAGGRSPTHWPCCLREHVPTGALL